MALLSERELGWEAEDDEDGHDDCISTEDSDVDVARLVAQRSEGVSCLHQLASSRSRHLEELQIPDSADLALAAVLDARTKGELSPTVVPGRPAGLQAAAFSRPNSAFVPRGSSSGAVARTDVADTSLFTPTGGSAPHSRHNSGSLFKLSECPSPPSAGRSITAIQSPGYESVSGGKPVRRAIKNTDDLQVEDLEAFPLSDLSAGTAVSSAALQLGAASSSNAVPAQAGRSLAGKRQVTFAGRERADEGDMEVDRPRSSLMTLPSQKSLGADGMGGALVPSSRLLRQSLCGGSPRKSLGGEDAAVGGVTSSLMSVASRPGSALMTTSGRLPSARSLCGSPVGSRSQSQIRPRTSDGDGLLAEVDSPPASRLNSTRSTHSLAGMRPTPPATAAPPADTQPFTRALLITARTQQAAAARSSSPGHLGDLPGALLASRRSRHSTGISRHPSRTGSEFLQDDNETTDGLGSLRSTITTKSRTESPVRRAAGSSSGSAFAAPMVQSDVISHLFNLLAQPAPAQGRPRS